MEASTYLIADTSIECFKGLHLIFTLMIAVPALIVYAVGLPFLALVLLIRSRKYRFSIWLQGRFDLSVLCRAPCKSDKN